MLGELLGEHWVGVGVGMASAFLAYRLIRFWELRRRLPPGPYPLPLVGNMLMFRGEGSTQDKLSQFAKKYGDPMTFWFGPVLAVIVTKKEAVREALITQQSIFCSRQDSTIIDQTFGGVKDIAMGKYDASWKIHRKLASRSLRAIIDAEKLESKANLAVKDVVKSLGEMNGEPVDPSRYISNVVFNVICSFAYGRSYEVTDQEFERLVFLNKKGNEIFSEILAFDFLPFAKYLPLRKMSGQMDYACSLFEELIDFIRNEIKDHRKTYHEGEIRDFIDSMIKEQILLGKEEGEKLSLLNEEHLVMIVLDFFNAGTDTTSSVLTWLFLYLALNPEIQERCFAEIDQVLGEREPGLSDRGRLPLIEACYNEALRLRPPAPLALPHVSIADTTLCGHHVPAGSWLMPNLYAMHTDPEGDFAPNPLDFDPVGHFLNPDGSPRKPHGFLPFGGGRRVCLGEQLAKNDLFLITTGLIQKLKFSTISGEDYTTEPDPKVDAVLYARPYKLSVTPRT